MFVSGVWCNSKCNILTPSRKSVLVISSKLISSLSSSGGGVGVGEGEGDADRLIEDDVPDNDWSSLYI